MPDQLLEAYGALLWFTTPTTGEAGAREGRVLTCDVGTPVMATAATPLQIATSGTTSVGSSMLTVC